LAVFFQAINAGDAAHCDAAVADASGASNPVCPPASAH
jgi:hypothetical protein